MKIKQGGRREGAGRPVSENPKITVTLRLAPDVVEFLRQSGASQAILIEKAVRAKYMISGEIHDNS